MNFIQKCAIAIGGCFLMLLLMWFFIFPQNPELEETTLKVPLPVSTDEFSNKYQAMKVLSCGEGNWSVDKIPYEVSNLEFKEKYGTDYCLINGKWYGVDYLNKRREEVQELFRLRQKMSKQNSTKASFSDITSKEVTVCYNVTIPLTALEKIDSSSYTDVKIDFENKKAILISCKKEVEKKSQVFENEVERITQLVSGGIE